MNRYWPLFLLLASVWGASYLFIKVAVDGGLEPGPLMCSRAAIGAAILCGYLARTMGRSRAVAELRGSWRQWSVLGLIGTAIPFWLVAWGETHVDSGIAAVAQSTVPLFTVLLGLRFLPHEPLTRGRVLGLALGPGRRRRPRGRASGWRLVVDRGHPRGRALLGRVCVRRDHRPAEREGHARPGARDGRDDRAAVSLLPLALLEAPSSSPDGGALLSLLALAVLGTAFAQLVMYRLINLVGARRMSLVTYLMPGFALVYGAVLLDEPVTAPVLAGLGLILAGVALGSGTIAAARRKPAEAPG